MSVETSVGFWADGAPFPMVLVDNARQLQWRNAAAARLLVSRNVVVMTDGVVDAVYEPHQDLLRTQITSATGVMSLRIVGPNADSACLVLAQRLSSPRQELVMLILRPCRPGGGMDGVSTADMRAMFRLTTTEYKVVKRLLSAETPSDIAATLNIKIGTIRTHVRNIYAKMGVTSREGLITRCLPFAWLDGGR